MGEEIFLKENSTHLEQRLTKAGASFFKPNEKLPLIVIGIFLNKLNKSYQ